MHRGANVEKVGLIVRGREGLRIDLDARPGAKFIIPRRVVERLLGEEDRVRVYEVSRGMDTDVVEGVGAAYLTGPKKEWVEVDIPGGVPLLTRLYACRWEVVSVDAGLRSAAEVYSHRPPHSAPPVKKIYRVKWSVGGFGALVRRAAQHEGREAGLPGRTDRASEKMVTCPRCGTRHPYASIGNLCTACVEARARAEEYGDALAAGYRMDRRGAWHRIEQAREERGVFGEDGGRD